VEVRSTVEPTALHVGHRDVRRLSAGVPPFSCHTTFRRALALGWFAAMTRSGAKIATMKIASNVLSRCRSVASTLETETVKLARFTR
jgi:hypothetical protein